MNKIVLIGNLTHDPETRSTASGVTVCSFTIAVNRRFASQGGEKQTDFFRINAWRQLGDVCSRYLAKGRKVAVIGELQARTYEAKDGTTRMSLDVAADEVEFLSSGGGGRNEPTDADAPPAPEERDPETGYTQVDPEDQPF